MNYYRYEVNASLLQQIALYLQGKGLDIFEVPFCIDNLKMTFPETKIEAVFTMQKKSLEMILKEGTKERIKGRLTTIKTNKGSIIYAEYHAGESEYMKKRLAEALKFSACCYLLLNAAYKRKSDEEAPFEVTEETIAGSDEILLQINQSAGAEETPSATRGHSAPAEPFSVKGHYRHLKSGKIVWVRAYEKNSKR